MKHIALYADLKSDFLFYQHIGDEPEVKYPRLIGYMSTNRFLDLCSAQTNMTEDQYLAIDPAEGEGVKFEVFSMTRSCQDEAPGDYKLFKRTILVNVKTYNKAAT